MLIEETTVPDAVLPVEDFKAHLRLGTSFGQDTTQDDVLTGFLRAAMSAIEARTGKVMIRRSFSWSVTSWQAREAQVLPVAPVAQVTRVALVAQDGNESVVSASSYWLEQDSQRPRLRASGGHFLSVPRNGSAVIEFEAGFGANWSELPADMKQAMLMLAAHYYEYRHETSLGDGCMPFGVTSLIERYKPMRMGFGSGR